MKVRSTLPVHVIPPVKRRVANAAGASFARGSVHPLIDHRWSGIMTVSTAETFKVTFPPIRVITAAGPRVNRISTVLLSDRCRP